MNQDNVQTRISILDYLNFSSPTKGQKNALTAMSEFVDQSCNDDFLILCGAAGTGKSSITSALVNYLNQIDLKYQIAAPTGRAASIIGRKSETLANTIHSLIYNVNTEDDTFITRYTRKKNIATDQCIFIIDESSMLSTLANGQEQLFQSQNGLLQDLIAFVKDGNPSNKIFFLGDKNQLPPISETDSLALQPQYLESKYKLKGSIHLLTEVKRTEDGSYILQNAIETIKGMETNKSQVPINAKKINFYSAASKVAERFIEQGNNSCISIGKSHKANKFFNDMVRKNLFKGNIKLLEKGDLVMITQKWNRNGQTIFSGDHAIVENVDFSKKEIVAGFTFCPIQLKIKTISGVEQIIDDTLLIESINEPSGFFGMEAEKALCAERFRKNPIYRENKFRSDDRFVGAIRLTYGYSITCNKAQGGEWDEVYMNNMAIPSLKYQYTAITRAVKELILY